MTSNYPPGVTGNEPQITGEWPIEVVVEQAIEDIQKVVNTLEDTASYLDDQGFLSAKLNDEFFDVQQRADALKMEVESMIPEEPGL